MSSPKHTSSASPNSVAAALAVAVVVVTTVGCDPPQHPRRYTKTLVENVCHVAYDCCTAVERTAFSTLTYPTKAACLEELDTVFGGGLAAAEEAVDRGTATFDAAAAQACTEAHQAAIDRCEGGGAFINADGRLSFISAGLAVDLGDAECAALVQRGFTRGTVEDGGDCVSDVECADFGGCVVDDDNGAKVTRSGTCRASPGKGDACDLQPCLPGLVCVSGSCDEAPAPAADGEPCLANELCESGFCKGLGGDRTCTTSGETCFSDFDCMTCVAGKCADGVTACGSAFDCPVPEGACAEPSAVCARPDVDDSICDGRDLFAP